MLPLLQLAELLQARLIPPAQADNAMLGRVASVRTADVASLLFAESESALQEALASPAAAVLTTAQLAASVANPTKPLLTVPHPRLAFAQASRLLQPAAHSGGIHPTAILGSDARKLPPMSRLDLMQFLEKM